MYDVTSKDANRFIDSGEVKESLEKAAGLAGDRACVLSILEKAKTFKGLGHREAAVLAEVKDPDILDEIYSLARRVKEHIYGRRIVIFAPLYLSDFCTNGCLYCGYSSKNKSARRRLNREELKEEVRVLESMGHKRLALEAGEDPKNCPLDYVIECIDTIYGLRFRNGAIRRLNVNIAATTGEEYGRLKDAAIGTYILFQETYHKPTYLDMHPSGPKSDYEWHTEAHDRAMAAGIDDVGLGVLYGLYDWKYDTIALLMHAEHLEATFGVGPHTVSVPRLRPAFEVSPMDFPHLLPDAHFKQLVAVLRLAVPYAGMILSTREQHSFRKEIISVGISQISAGSCTGVGGYARAEGCVGADAERASVVQFEPEDHRHPREILKELLQDGYVPSYCTACYREGRTGDRFMELAKSGKISDVCQANALLTLQEYMEDYGDDELSLLASETIHREIGAMPSVAFKTRLISMLSKIRNGARDIRF